MLAVLLAGICGISAFSQNEFHYTNNLQTDKCNVCYDLLCYTMDKARCAYYSLANDITGNKIKEHQSSNVIIDEVDDMIFEYTERASNVPEYKDCVPFISQYTNCNRDNICLGCKTCNCDSVGLWNCSSTQHCRPDHDTPLNHHTLVILMEKLNEYKNTIKNIRNKRSVSKDMEIISPQEIFNWMYEVQRLNIDKDFPNTTTELDNNLTTINNIIKNGSSILLSWPNQNEKQNFNDSEPESIVFEDLLNNLNYYKGHNSLEDKTPPSKNMLSGLEPTAINEITTSLLNDTTILDDDLQTNKSDTDRIIDGVFAFIDSDINENFNYKRDITHNTRRLDKRDVSLQSFNVTSIPDNNTDKVNELQNILLPLHNIVLQRQEELKKLIDIRDKLMTYIKPVSDINITTSLTNISKENITNLYFIQLSSIQNFDDLRKRDQNIPNKYIQKLKRDIQEVVRDIAGIQRFSNFSAIPKDLKILIRAMRNYVKKENELKKISNSNKNTIDFRRKIETDNDFKAGIKPIDEIIHILEVLDNDLPTYNVLNSLNPETRKILTRILNTYYENNITMMKSQINKTNNFTKNLEGIGKNWNEMTIDIVTSSLSERLYSMKLFHIVLSMDIEKIEDALAVLQFAEYRRMNLIDDITGETIVERIAEDLRKTDRRFTHMIQVQTVRPIKNTNTGHGNKISKKKSFLQHIKTLLKNSKTDIRKLLHRKIPKSQIVKHIAKKKIDELRKNKLAEYEQTMQRWQSNLNIISRNKRAAGIFQNFINSIRNIFQGQRRSYKKKENKTEKVKKRSHKRGPKKTTNISTTTIKTAITAYQNKNNTSV